MTDRLYLSKHVHVAFSGVNCIFLDLRRDRYISASRIALASLDPAPAGMPEADGDSQTDGPKAPTSKLLTALKAAGLVTSEPQLGKPFLPTPAPSPAAELASPDTLRRSAEDRRHACMALLACVRATGSLRFHSIESTVNRVISRGTKGRAAANAFDYERASALVDKFQKFRPMYPRNYLCLFDSLALLDFLAFYRMYPRWLFGIRTQPFEAHCWVQEGHTVFNDTVEHTRQFTPILMI